MPRVSIPFPISSNNAFSQARSGRRYLSARYKRWRRIAHQEIIVSRMAALAGRVDVLIELTPPDKRARDADNFIKPILDLLVVARIIADDNRKLVRSVKAIWTDDPPGRKKARAYVHISKVPE